MNVYALAADWQARRELLDRRLAGRVAMYTLMLEQRRATSGDVAFASSRLEAAHRDREAHEQAPPGTALVSRTAGAPGRIWVVAGGKTVYEGPADGYSAPPPA